MALTAWTMHVVVARWTGDQLAGTFAAPTYLTSTTPIRGFPAAAPYFAAVMYLPLVIHAAATPTSRLAASSGGFDRAPVPGRAAVSGAGRACPARDHRRRALGARIDAGATTIVVTTGQLNAREHRAWDPLLADPGAGSDLRLVLQHDDVRVFDVDATSPAARLSTGASGRSGDRLP